MLGTLLLTSALASTSPETIAPPPTEFTPDHASVEFGSDGSVEILAFDAGDQLVGVLLVTTSAERLQFDASFDDGFVEGVLMNDQARFEPRVDMVSSEDLQRRCADARADQPDRQPMWWTTDLADPCAAVARIALMFGLVERDISRAERAVTSAVNTAQRGPTRRECIIRFVAAGTCVASRWPCPTHGLRPSRASMACSTRGAPAGSTCR